MNYVPVLGSLIWFMGLFGVSALLLYGVLLMDEDWKCCDREWLWMVWLVACLAGCLGFWGVLKYAEPVFNACLFLLAVYLVVCTVMDSMLCKVNDFMQYVGVIGGSVCIWYQTPEPGIGISLIFFAGMQYFLFLKMYGGADGMGFLICALYLAGMGRGIEDYLFHMLLCYFTLAIVQGLQGNITRKGKLVNPVPMLPYLSFSFLILIQPYEELFH